MSETMNSRFYRFLHSKICQKWQIIQCIEVDILPICFWSAVTFLKDFSSRTVYILLVPSALQTTFARYYRPPFLKHMFGVQIFQLWVFMEELRIKLCMVDR